MKRSVRKRSVNRKKRSVNRKKRSATAKVVRKSGGAFSPAPPSISKRSMKSKMARRHKKQKGGAQMLDKEYDDDENCPICISSIKGPSSYGQTDSTVAFVCTHIFHRDCVNMLQPSAVCPLCRKKTEPIAEVKLENDNFWRLTDRLWTWKNGNTYLGEWENGKMHDQGTHTYANGDKYVGKWKDNNMHGLGTYTWANGAKYVGNWRDNKRSGQGTTTHAGHKYVGEWEDNKKNGQGTHTWPDGMYVGAWEDNKRAGKGMMTLSDGMQYVGEWADNKKNGQGTMTYADGTMVDQMWEDGIEVGLLAAASARG